MGGCCASVHQRGTRPPPAPSAICNPNGTPFYDGQTNCLERRWREHRDSISVLPRLREQLAGRSRRPYDVVLTYRRINRTATYPAEGTGAIFRELGEASWSRDEALALETTCVHRMTVRGHELMNLGEHRAIPKQYASDRRYERRYHSDMDAHW